MTDTSWGDEAAPAKKKSIAPWLWFCAAGCLVALILGAIVAKVGFDMVKTWGDAETQLPALQEAMPFDPLPPETEFVQAIRFPMNWFIFRDTRGYVMFFFIAGGGDGEELRKTILSEKFTGFGMGSRSNSESAELSLQGRDVKGLRFVQERGTSKSGGDAEGASILLEVGPEGGDHVVIVQITRRGSGETVTDDEVKTLLRPFHVGPER